MDAASTSSIVLVEDHAILRHGLRALIELESDLCVVGEAGNAAEALPVVRDTRPALVITDLAMPGESGLLLIHRLRALSTTLRVLVLTAYNIDAYARAALHADADGYVPKQAGRDELLRAIRAIVAGHRYFADSVSTRLTSDSSGHDGSAGSTCDQLTSREREVLKGVALGESNKRLAHALELSVKTIEKHRGSLMRKLRLHNTAAVTLFAVRSGLIPAIDVEQCFLRRYH